MTSTHRRFCPHCRADLRTTIEGKTYDRAIGIEIPGLYDGILFWRCPECGLDWHRFPSGHALRERAEKAMRR